MRKLVDISFNMDHTIHDPDITMDKYKEGIGYAAYLKEHLDILIIRHIGFAGSIAKAGINFSFFKGSNNFGYASFKTLFHLKKEDPDIVIVQGTIFPIQVIMIRMLLGRRPLIIVQHHGNMPFKGMKRTFQKFADRLTDAYLFTAIGNVKAWMDNGIIRNKDKCLEVLEGSTYMAKQDKQECRARLQISDDSIFLWVGRLDAEKDPITVLKGFDRYLCDHPDTGLYMIYQNDNLLQ